MSGSQACPWCLYQGGTDGGSAGNPIQKYGLCSSGVLRSAMPAMSAPPAPCLVPGSTVVLVKFCIGTAEAALEHSILYDKSGSRCDKNMKFLMKKYEFSYSGVLGWCHGSANVTVYLHKARCLQSQVYRTSWNPHHVCSPLLIAMSVHGSVPARNLAASYCSLDCIISLEFDLTLWCLIDHGPWRWQAML